MNKIVIVIMLALVPLCSNAQSQGLFGKRTTSTKQQKDYTPYMQGAVPVVNGEVVFTQTIAAPGKTKSELYRLVASWASARYLPNVENGKWTDHDYFRNLNLASVKADDTAGKLECQGNEEIVFRNRFLEKDYSEIDYKLYIEVQDGAVTATMKNISYVYTFTDEKSRFSAESFITDEESFNKKGQFYKDNRKFRVKTIDLKNELFSEIATIIK